MLHHGGRQNVTNGRFAMLQEAASKKRRWDKRRASVSVVRTQWYEAVCTRTRRTTWPNKREAVECRGSCSAGEHQATGSISVHLPRRSKQRNMEPMGPLAAGREAKHQGQIRLAWLGGKGGRS